VIEMSFHHYIDLEVISPRNLDELLELLTKLDSDAIIIAGGTDVNVLLRKGRVRAKTLIDISRIKELKFIKYENSFIRIGALTTLSEIIENTYVKEYLPLLHEALLNVGSWQIRNLATIGGNIGRASPTGDVLLTLYALDAKIKLLSKYGERIVNIEDLVTGPGKLNINKYEVIAEILIQPMLKNDIYYHKKLSFRKVHAVASVSIAMVLRQDLNGPCNKFVKARMVLGAVAPTPIRIHEVEEILCRELLDYNGIERISNLIVSKIKPRSGIRGSAKFRKLATMGLVKEGLKTILDKSCNSIKTTKLN